MAAMTATHAQTDNFPYPTIPSMLATPSERGAYLLEHYWDNYDFTDTTLVKKQEISEQGFANFIDLLPRLDSLAVVVGIETFSNKAFGKETPTKVADRFDNMVEHYLSNPNSPMRNEDLYILFLEAQVKTLTANGSDTTRPKAKLTTAKKNRPGSKAADIALTTRQGNRSTLYAIDAPMLLLIFYDPACEHCQEILAKLRTNTQLNQLIAAGKLKVVADYTEGDRTLWKETNNELPQEWIVGIDESKIVDNNIYDIPAMPVIYLLDNNKTVILKDPSIDILFYCLENI